jgi:hypothetical protein
MKKIIYLLSLTSTLLFANSQESEHIQEISELFVNIVTHGSEVSDELALNIQRTIQDNSDEFLIRFSANLASQDSRDQAE